MRASMVLRGIEAAEQVLLVYEAAAFFQLIKPW